MLLASAFPKPKNGNSVESTKMGKQEEEDVLRGASKNLPEGFWGYSFASLSPLDSEIESYTKEMEVLKEKVRDILARSKEDFTQNIELIDLLCRLGVSYHYEDEIEMQLKHIFTLLPKLLEDNDYDLNTLAILFRVLRQYGYKKTSDVFMKFKDESGEFKTSIANNVKSILNLYEACFLGVHGEDILDEALLFARKQLQTIAESSSPHIQKHIRNALFLPCHRNVERFVTLDYISFYEADESRNEILLRFAKLDFNRLQLIYRKELALLSEWWKNTNVVECLPYARSRIAESYLFAIASIFEPQYSHCRMALCKHIQLVTVLDDTYDSYGMLDELERLTTALERFTPDAMDELSEHLKFLFSFLLRFFEETENDTLERYFYKVSYSREMLKELARSYFVEKTWHDKGKTPTFEEYMVNGKVSIGFDLVTAAMVQGMETAGMKEIVWLRNDPTMVSAAKLISRLMNDISERKNETKREDFPKGMDCYMKQYGVSRHESIEAILQLLDDKWKDMNEDLLKPNNVPKTMVKYIFNFARTSMVSFIGPDLFTYTAYNKELITSMVLNPLSL